MSFRDGFQPGDVTAAAKDAPAWSWLEGGPFKAPQAPEDAALDSAAILDAARQAVTVDRAATHGDAERTFGLIAALWSPLIGVDLTPAEVCLMLAQLKIARAWGNPGHGDNWVDLAGYAACGGELAQAAETGGADA